MVGVINGKLIFESDAMLNKLIAILFLTSLFGQLNAADLFQNGKLRQINSGDLIVGTDTIGGYSIFQDDGRWKFVNGKDSQTIPGHAQEHPQKMGNVLLDYYQGNILLARQWLNTNIEVGNGKYWAGTPCSSDHLVIRDKGQGRQNNCMTIDPKIVTLGAEPKLFLAIVLTNNGNYGRYYEMWLYVNADLLGIRNTGVGNWTKEELRTKPYMQAALDRLTRWAELLQDGSIRAFDLSKPQNAYEKVPSLVTLLPVPDDIAGQKFSFNFLSAVEDLGSKPAFTSIAYAHWEDYKDSWGFSTGKASQEIADAEALEFCEKHRQAYRPTAPSCAIYRLPKPSSAIKVNQQPPLTDMRDKLEKLKSFFTSGAITKDQYDSQVKDLLNKL